MNRATQVLIFASLFSTVDVLATQQVRDAVEHQGGKGHLIECPLNDLLRGMEPVPKFDVPSTSNYKGYTAAWEIRGSRLYLVSFSAASGGVPVAAPALFAGNTLPLVADWYSGPLNVISGTATRERGYFTFERVIHFRVSKGVITATVELRNVREDKLEKL